MTNCDSIKQLVAGHLMEQFSVMQSSPNFCVVTLPLLTLDGRSVDVFVEPRAVDFFIVHDGGKAVNELILQGIKMTPSLERHLELLAVRFGIAYTDEMFQTGAKVSSLATVISSVGMCSMLAMTELLEKAPVSADKSLEEQVGGVLRRWSKRRAKVTERVQVVGEIKQHEFDYLVSPLKGRHPVSVSILNPTAGALSAAERFGFKMKDMANTRASKWRAVAIEAKAEVWSAEARKIVSRCADVVLPVTSGDQLRYEQIGEVLDCMVA